MDGFFALQWVAMFVTIAASWLVASPRKSRRNAGFWIFLASNMLWVWWGWHDRAYALVTLQVVLAAMNVRGVLKSEQAT